MHLAVNTIHVTLSSTSLSLQTVLFVFGILDFRLIKMGVLMTVPWFSHFRWEFFGSTGVFAGH